ncbi:MAG: DUF1570 domain-containing protein [Tepidisphaera sp.]|nr:DUF1570 domain-containing protein [Tepidisphaera sp.]
MTGRRGTGGRVRPLLVASLLCAALVGCASPPDTIGRIEPSKADAASPAVSSPVSSVILNTETWTLEGRAGQVLTTPHYRLFTTIDKSFLLDRMPGFMEAAMGNYTSSLAELPPPAGSLETYLLGNRPQWARVTQRVMGDQAEVYLRIQRGGFAANGKAILYDIGPRDTFAIAAHEGWHQYTQSTFKTRLPTSLEEGLATYMEGFRWERGSGAMTPIFLPWANLERFEQLRDAAADGTLMPLDVILHSTPQELLKDDQTAALTYYAQVWALIHFLNEGEGGAYRGALRMLLTDAARGDLLGKIRAKYGPRAASAYSTRSTGVDLLELYTTHSASELNGAYQAFIERCVRVGSKQLVVQGKSPIQ